MRGTAPDCGWRSGPCTSRSRWFFVSLPVVLAWVALTAPWLLTVNIEERSEARRATAVFWGKVPVEIRRRSVASPIRSPMRFQRTLKPATSMPDRARSPEAVGRWKPTIQRWTLRLVFRSPFDGSQEISYSPA